MRRNAPLRCRNQQGFTLIETMMAMVILTLGVLGTAALFGVAAGANKGQGEVATRTIEYCQDKMEQLNALTFGDAGTDTTVYPSSPTGGPGLGGPTMAPNSTLGSIDPTGPVAQFVDYLDAAGNLLTSSTGAFYTRQWMIQTDSTATVKTITVVTRALTAAGGRGAPPSTTLICQKTSF